jgi:hypothetical protein
MENLVRRYESLVAKISAHLALGGINKPLAAENPVFSHLNLHEQEEALSRFENEMANLDVTNPQADASSQLLQFCEYHGLEPVDKSLYGKMSNDFFWEVIDFKLNQLYRNRRIFEMVSYSLEEMVAYSPWQLFARNESALESLMTITEELRTGDRLIDLRHIPSYIIVEALSKNKLKFVISHQFCCPLRSKKTDINKAFVSVFRAHRFKQGPNEKLWFLDSTN